MYIIYNRLILPIWSIQQNVVTLVTLSRFRGGGIFLVRKILLPNWTKFFG